MLTSMYTCVGAWLSHDIPIYPGWSVVFIFLHLFSYSNLVNMLSLLCSDIQCFIGMVEQTEHIKLRHGIVSKYG